MRDKYVVELGLGEGVCDVSGKRIGQLVFNKTLIDACAFAIVEQRIAHWTAENPIQRRDVWRLKRIEIAADDGWFRRIMLGHRGLEFLQTPRRLCKDEMKVEHSRERAVQ